MLERPLCAASPSLRDRPTGKVQTANGKYAAHSSRESERYDEGKHSRNQATFGVSAPSARKRGRINLIATVEEQEGGLIPEMFGEMEMQR